jgi:hypothetical protein
VERLDARRDRERAGDQRERAAPAGGEPRERPCRQCQQRELDEPAREMVDGRRAGLRLEEVVVGDVQRDDRDRRPEPDRVAAQPPAPSRMRRGGGREGRGAHS